ncbi:MAG: GNAT family N-acetyltransferase [Clostridiales bacterium]|nr:GNAT family N-acetyltransferase [Clostridiales bacterium]
MIREVEEKHIAQCVKVIRESFLTVAERFGFTAENAPLFTAFATTDDTLKRHFELEHRPMYAFFDGDTVVGYYSLLLQADGLCELNHLCVSPAHRGKGIGAELLEHAFMAAKERNCRKMNIGIVEENRTLRKWYESFGFVHLGSKKPKSLPFVCGFMEKCL